MLPEELPDGRAPLFVITGFLGSGKTTLLNHMLAQPDLRETAVLINEFGDVGIDNLLVSEIRGELVLLQSGCVCCSVLGDLSYSIKDLFARREAGDIPTFKRLVLETTGLADPAPILHTLLNDPALSLLIYLDSVITTVDALHGEGHLEEHDESFRQVVLADRIVLTKVDLAPAASAETLRHKLNLLNAAAKIHPAVRGKVPPEELLGAGMQELGRRVGAMAAWLETGGPDRAVHAHLERIRTLAVRFTRPIEFRRFSRWITAVTAEEGARLLRVKGVLDIAGRTQPTVFQSVQKVLYPTVMLPSWPTAERASRLVFIARDVSEEHLAELRASLESALGQESG